MKIPGRIYDALDERFEIKEPVGAALNKPVPAGINWLYCLGGITLFLFIIQVITGALLALYYVPTPDHAYDSVVFITYDVNLGWLIRGMHHWAANLMVITVGLHMLRVFYHAAYKPLKELNWITGVFLLVLVLAFAFTGYLLPWDQTAYWATMVGTSVLGTVPVIGDFLLRVVRGGAELGAVALVRFFWAHTFLLPLVAAVTMGGHLLMVRRQGIRHPL